MASIKNIAWAFFLAADLAAAHSVITNAVGDAGGSGSALGVDPSTPRDGTGRRPFQQDATRFRGASADTFGETLAGGDNQVEQGTSDILEETGDQLPQVTPGGSVKMTLHQVNADGAGPYTCMINSDATGAQWDNIDVTTNVDGNDRGRNRDGSKSDHPLVAAIPAGQTCTGTVAGEKNVCLVRCQNPARAGPFGGVVPVQMAQTTTNNNNNNNGTATDNNASNNANNNASNNKNNDNAAGNAANNNAANNNAANNNAANNNANNNANKNANKNANDNAAANTGNDDDDDDTDAQDENDNGNDRNVRRVVSPRALKSRAVRFSA